MGTVELLEAVQKAAGEASSARHWDLSSRGAVSRSWKANPVRRSSGNLGPLLLVTSGASVPTGRPMPEPSVSTAASGVRPGGAGMRRGCRLGARGSQAHESPALLTFSVHSSCCGGRRQCRLAATCATVPTHSPAIVDPAGRPAADLSPLSGGG